MPKPIEKQSRLKYLLALRTYDPTILRLHDIEYDSDGKVIVIRISRTSPLL